MEKENLPKRQQRTFSYGNKVSLITDDSNIMHVITAVIKRDKSIQYEITCNNLVSVQPGCMLTKWVKKSGTKQAGFLNDLTSE